MVIPKVICQGCLALRRFMWNSPGFGWGPAPQTNGMVERFNGRIQEVVRQTKFRSAKELRDTLYQYCRVYNHHILQRNLGHITPVEALKKWQKNHPHLFKKSVYKQTGLDGCLVP